MAITHGSAVRGDLAQAVLDAVDGGTGAGKVVVMTAADAVLATIALQDPSYSRSGAVLTALGVPLSTTATGTGTAAKAKVVDSDDTTIYAGSCGMSDADFIIDNTSLVAGQTVRLTAMTYTAPV